MAAPAAVRVMRTGSDANVISIARTEKEEDEEEEDEEVEENEAQNVE